MPVDLRRLSCLERDSVIVVPGPDLEWEFVGVGERSGLEKEPWGDLPRSSCCFGVVFGPGNIDMLI